MSDAPLLTTDQMASFVARGFLRFDAVIPDDINQQALEELPRLFRTWLDEFRGVTGGAAPTDVAGRDARAEGTAVPEGAVGADGFDFFKKLPSRRMHLGQLVGAVFVLAAVVVGEVVG
jgi:hypothetical protein